MEANYPQFYSDEAVFFGERLYSVKPREMEETLHKNIGALTFRSRKTKDLGKGTGTLISSNIVLTAAHNLYCAATGEVYFDLKFYPGVNGPLEKYYEIEDFFLPGKFILNPGVTTDYALLKLKKSVNSKEFLPLC